MRTIVLGPPGTGKTTTLLNKVVKQSKKFRGATNTKEWLEIIDYVYNKYNKKNSNKNLDFDEM